MADLAGAVALTARPLVPPFRWSSSARSAASENDGRSSPLASQDIIEDILQDTLTLSPEARRGATSSQTASGQTASGQAAMLSQTDLSQGRPAAAPSRRGLLASSLRRLLDPFPGRSSPLERLFASIERSLKKLEESDSEWSLKLETLLKTLEKLNGRAVNAEGTLNRLESAFRDLVRALGGGAGNVDLPVAPPPAAAPAQPANQPQWESFSFVLDIEVTQSVNLDAVMAELTDQGVSVQWINVEASSSFRLRIELNGQRQSQQPRQAEPLILDLNGDGVQPTSYEKGVDFDVDADGAIDRTAFVRGGDGALAMDRNGNGAIDDGAELFGNQHGAANGFEELAKFDENGDKVIDAKDAVYESLGVLRDANADGRLDPGEFTSLKSLGIESISLVNALLREDDGKGNTFAERGTFRRSDGSVGQAVDVWFGYIPGQKVSRLA